MCMSSKPPVIKITKCRLITAIEGTGGIVRRIAANLGSTPITVRKYLKEDQWDKPDDWDEIADALWDEREQTKDIAEEAISFAMEQRQDLALAYRASIDYLKLLAHERGFKEVKEAESKVSIEVTHEMVDVNKLPLAERQKLLEVLDADVVDVGVDA
jgi:predicted transcriptional regulator